MYRSQFAQVPFRRRSTFPSWASYGTGRRRSWQTPPTLDELDSSSSVLFIRYKSIRYELQLAESYRSWAKGLARYFNSISSEDGVCRFADGIVAVIDAWFCWKICQHPKKNPIVANSRYIYQETNLHFTLAILLSRLFRSSISWIQNIDPSRTDYMVSFPEYRASLASRIQHQSWHWLWHGKYGQNLRSRRRIFSWSYFRKFRHGTKMFGVPRLDLAFDLEIWKMPEIHKLH